LKATCSFSDYQEKREIEAKRSDNLHRPRSKKANKHLDKGQGTRRFSFPFIAFLLLLNLVQQYTHFNFTTCSQLFTSSIFNLLFSASTTHHLPSDRFQDRHRSHLNADITHSVSDGRQLARPCLSPDTNSLMLYGLYDCRRNNPVYPRRRWISKLLL